MSIPVKMSGALRLDLVLPDGTNAGAAIRFDGGETVDVTEACALIRRWAFEVELHARHAMGQLEACG